MKLMSDKLDYTSEFFLAEMTYFFVWTVITNKHGNHLKKSLHFSLVHKILCHSHSKGPVPL